MNTTQNKRKSPDMISDLTAQDYLGMVIKIDGDRIYMSMAKYIENACRILKAAGMSHGPVDGPVGTESPLLSPQGTPNFIAAVGMVGWLAQTPRFAVAYEYRQVARHNASHVESAMEAKRTTLAYLQQDTHYCISIHIYEDVLNLKAMLNHTEQDTEPGSFMVDSNQADDFEICTTPTSVTKWVYGQDQQNTRHVAIQGNLSKFRFGAYW